ncbi:hypothetical protein GPECTOR_83g290 [Gonium pectorale]|uniref:Uncharacterized protein n=1 Tax=Gonium pectorale TaxID=33097 RepID=A0A150G1G0_GONPE|nr:hypothetical protein GPECTOR_83g290 [Gonium pectorale]|eukprot:KXZ43678.1 hypothetical protein GPECTOR_83g290 [Gonium pectorale]
MSMNHNGPQLELQPGAASESPAADCGAPVGFPLLDLPQHLQEEILLRSKLQAFVAGTCCRGLHSALCSALASPAGVARFILHACGPEALVALYSNHGQVLRSLLSYIPGRRGSAEPGAEGEAARAVLEALVAGLGGTVHSASLTPSRCMAALLWNAGEAGHLPVFDYLAKLLRADAAGGTYDPNDCDGAPLVAAAKIGHEEAVEVLLAAGADPRLMNGLALGAAASRGHWGIARRLMAAGSPVNGWRGEALAAAVAQGQEECVAELLTQHGAHANVRALLVAAQHGRGALLRRLAAEIAPGHRRGVYYLGATTYVAAMTGQDAAVDEAIIAGVRLGWPAAAFMVPSLTGALVADKPATRRRMVLRQAAAVPAVLMRMPSRVQRGLAHCGLSLVFLTRVLPVALVERKWDAVRPLLGACQRGTLVVAAAGAAWAGWRRPGWLAAALCGWAVGLTGYSRWEARLVADALQ